MFCVIKKLAANCDQFYKVFNNFWKIIIASFHKYILHNTAFLNSLQSSG